MAADSPSPVADAAQDAAANGSEPAQQQDDQPEATGDAGNGQAAAEEDAAAQKDGPAASSPAGSPRRKERSSRKDRDRDDKERKEHKSSRHRDEDDRKSRKDSDRRRDDKKDKDKERSSKRGRSRSRDRDRKSDKKEDREKSRHRSRHRSSSRERRKSRARSPSRDRSRRSRHRSRSRDRSRRRRSRSPSRRGGRNRSPSTESDGMGGYVPRKRQEQPREGVWSLATAGYSTAYVDPYGAIRSQGPQDPEEMKRQMQEQQLRARQLVLQQQAASAVAAASKTQREVYIGNLVGGLVTEDNLRQLFDNTMAAAFPEQMVSGMNAVVNVSMHSEGRYAFVELRTSEMATAALQLSGQVQLLGQPISVGRPSGYVDPGAAQLAAAAAAKALEAFQKGEPMELGTPGQTAAAGVSPSPAAAAGVSPSPAAAAAPAAAQTPTNFLAVSGMVTAEVLADDTEYAEVIEDLQEECGKYGAVLAVAVPRPPNAAATAASVFNTGNYGKGFVSFADAGGAKAARDAIHGRLFAGITVQVAFVSQQEFETAQAAAA